MKQHKIGDKFVMSIEFAHAYNSRREAQGLFVKPGSIGVISKIETIVTSYPMRWNYLDESGISHPFHEQWLGLVGWIDDDN